MNLLAYLIVEIAMTKTLKLGFKDEIKFLIFSFPIILIQVRYNCLTKLVSELAFLLDSYEEHLTICTLEDDLKIIPIFLNISI